MDLKLKWEQLKLSGSGEFRQLRFPGDCFANLHLALDEDDKRCLVLYLPTELYDTYVNFKPKSLANIAISFTFFEQGAGLVVKLINDYLGDLFDDLVSSLYRRISPINDKKIYTSKLIETYWEWANFFEKTNESDLSKAEIKGIAGELSFLKLLLENTSINKNEIVQSWCGLYGDDKDFILRNHAFEIKTISSSGHEVKISSEYQLEPITDKELFLVVIELDEADPADRQSFTLKDKYLEIKSIILKTDTEIYPFLKAMAEKGIDDNSLGNYDFIRFRFRAMKSYEAGHYEFPVITKSKLGEGIKNVTYNIELGKIARFKRELEYEKI